MTTSDGLAAIERSLGERTDELAAALRDLAVAQQNNADATVVELRRRTRLVWVMLACTIAVAVGVVLVGVGVHRVRSAQDDTRDAVAAIRSAQADSRETLRTIKDCTDPSGTCAQRGQEQTAKAVAQIADAQAIATWCAIHSATLVAARECIAHNAVAP